jgi:hypothetical protein
MDAFFSKKNMTFAMISRVKSLIRQAIERSNKPLNKYNQSIHMNTEDLSGEPSDRTSADADGQYQAGEPIQLSK